MEGQDIRFPIGVSLDVGRSFHTFSSRTLSVDGGDFRLSTGRRTDSTIFSENVRDSQITIHRWIPRDTGAPFVLEASESTFSPLDLLDGIYRLGPTQKRERQNVYDKLPFRNVSCESHTGRSSGGSRL